MPLYVNLHDLCKTLRCGVPRSEAVRSALTNAGYRCGLRMRVRVLTSRAG